jgi:hypothetical protein
MESLPTVFCGVSDLDKYKSELVVNGSSYCITFWYSDGDILNYRDCTKILHREDGPAMEDSDGNKSWYINGKRHRVDGPAQVLYYGSEDYYINDKYLTEEEFEKHPLRIKYLVYQEIMRLLSGE